MSGARRQSRAQSANLSPVVDLVFRDVKPGPMHVEDRRHDAGVHGMFRGATLPEAIDGQGRGGGDGVGRARPRRARAGGGPRLLRGISGCRRRNAAVSPYTCRTSSVVSVTRVRAGARVVLRRACFFPELAMSECLGAETCPVMAAHQTMTLGQAWTIRVTTIPPIVASPLLRRYR